MSFTNYLEAELLDHLFMKAAWTPPATLYIGLSTAHPGEDGSTVSEPAGGSYARVSVTNNKTTWSTSSAGTLSNAIVINFPTATGDWGTLTYFIVADAATNGNILCYGRLTTDRTITSGLTASFGVGDLDISVD